MIPVLNSGENFPIYDPNYLWGTTVYEKGGCVLHMLRHVVGDSAFFDALAAYRQAYEFSSAVTAEFQAVVETVAVQDLDWFFDEWIYDVGWPVYEYSWHAVEDEGQYAVNLVIDQVQTNGPVFTMPVDVKMTTAAGDTRWCSRWTRPTRSSTWCWPPSPRRSTLDPDNWILNEAEEVAHAGAGGDGSGRSSGLSRTCPILSAGQRPSATRCRGQQPIRLEIYDAAGRQVVSLIDGPVRPGWGEVTWDARDRDGRTVAPGTYFCRLSAAEGRSATRMIVLR